MWLLQAPKLQSRSLGRVGTYPKNTKLQIWSLSRIFLMNLFAGTGSMGWKERRTIICANQRSRRSSGNAGAAVCSAHCFSQLWRNPSASMDSLERHPTTQITWKPWLLILPFVLCNKIFILRTHSLRYDLYQLYKWHLKDIKGSETKSKEYTEVLFQQLRGFPA